MSDNLYFSENLQISLEKMIEINEKISNINKILRSANIDIPFDGVYSMSEPTEFGNFDKHKVYFYADLNGPKLFLNDSWKGTFYESYFNNLSNDPSVFVEIDDYYSTEHFPSKLNIVRKLNVGGNCLTSLSVVHDDITEEYINELCDELHELAIDHTYKLPHKYEVKVEVIKELLDQNVEQITICYKNHCISSDEAKENLYLGHFYVIYKNVPIVK